MLYCHWNLYCLFIPDHGGWLLFCGDLQFSLGYVNLPLISRKKYNSTVEETIDMSSRELLHHNQNLLGGKVIKVWCIWQFEKKKCDAVSWGRNKSPPPTVMIDFSLRADKDNHGKTFISRVGEKKMTQVLYFLYFSQGMHHSADGSNLVMLWKTKHSSGP